MLIDNKKTREISWNDFELSGNKENLIKQGWESFEPYGFGEFIGKAPEEVFEENYAQNELLNGDFRNGIDNWDDTYGGLIVDDNVGIAIPTDTRGASFYNPNIYLSKDKVYYVSFYSKFVGVDKLRYLSVNNGASNAESMQYIGFLSDNFEKISFVSNGFDKEGIRFYYSLSDNNDSTAYISNVLVVDLTKLFGKGNEPSKEWCDENLKYYPNWQDLTEEEKPVNAYEKGYTYIQPLDNGFTRIRTKGGDTDMKYKSPNFGQLAETGTDTTISLYVENNSDSMIRFSNNLAIGGVPYPDGAEYMITVPREYKGFAYLKGELVGRDVELDIRSDGNIDMIVSQPEIIEGHDLNAMMFMDELEDGRTHVRVFNPNQNTKLVYTGDKGIVGSPYTLSTEIENDGVPFTIKTSITDDITVNEGINVINKSGELKEEDIKIEIGVD